jgi:hypothetical protein
MSHLLDEGRTTNGGFIMKHNILANNHLTICVFVLAIIGFTLLSNQAPQLAVASSDIAPGPSMKETEAWIEREFPKIGRDSVVATNGKTRTETTYEIRDATLTDCTLKFQSISHWVLTPNAQSLTVTVPMKNIDLTRLVALEATPATGYTASKPSFVVTLVAQSDPSGSQRLFDTEFNNNDGKPPQTRSAAAVIIRVRDMDSANQTAETLRRAAVLCGAQDRPVDLTAMVSCETGVGAWLSCHPQSNAAAPTATVTSKSAGNSTSTMTNNEVIQLVKAGLSEQVVITSIRQAPTKDFDLTPTGLIALKKAKISDAIIVVMQEKNAPPQAVPESKPNTLSKYDPSLAEAVKPAAATPAPCAGIENMGVFKNQAMATAIGGGIVEWLLKIRNNTTVTKIVIYSYRDSYGGTPQSQVQIRGGEIATIRLDLTKSQFIAPVSDVRIVSCQ